jgi:hypothetical protein
MRVYSTETRRITAWPAAPESIDIITVDGAAGYMARRTKDKKQ